MNGARRTEAFLHEWRDGRWTPIVLPDGTRSDGKTDTYDRCVEGLLGSPETFFTSAFHAQNRRQLSAYRPSEIKGLLVELLGLEQIRAAGQEAGRVASRLQEALEQRRGALARHRSIEQAVQEQKASIDDAEARIRTAEGSRTEAQTALHTAQEQLAVREAERAAAAGTEALRQSLKVQLAEQAKRKTNLVSSHARLAVELKARRERAVAALRGAEEAAAVVRARLQRDEHGLQVLLAKRPAIQSAVDRLPTLAEQEQVARQAVQGAQEVSERCARTRQRLQVVAANRQGVEREVGAAVLRVRQLQERFQLTAQVPCSGTDLQGACKLLADAREARVLQPSADAKIAQLRQDVVALDEERDRLQSEIANAGDPAIRLQQARAALDAVVEQRRMQSADAALAAPLAQAQDRLRAIAEERTEVEQRVHIAQATAREEHGRCDAEAREAHERSAAEVAELDATTTRLGQQLAGLPPAFDDRKRAEAAQAAQAAKQALAVAETARTAAVAQRAELAGRLQSSMSHLTEGAMAATAVAHLETELALWTALAKALGNDGVIALCIDDVGPTLARLTNELLLGCHGPRFTVSITTQIETAKKDLKEGFDVIVFDAETGASKSVALMSGGERLLLDSALTRAIAVYLAQSAGRRYQTLYSDEADGPLDPERKRMFVQMKREVLRLGGYEQEIFVSQTPELWEMADRVIDLASIGAAKPVMHES
jgi:exonuclease SbcC